MSGLESYDQEAVIIAGSNDLNWTATNNKENTPKETCSKTPVESLTWKKPRLILFQTTKSRARNIFLLGSFLNLWRSSCLGACLLVLLTLLNLLPQIRLTWILFDFPSALSLKKTGCYNILRIMPLYCLFFRTRLCDQSD